MNDCWGPVDHDLALRLLTPRISVYNHSALRLFASKSFIGTYPLLGETLLSNSDDSDDEEKVTDIHATPRYITSPRNHLFLDSPREISSTRNFGLPSARQEQTSEYGIFQAGKM